MPNHVHLVIVPKEEDGFERYWEPWSSVAAYVAGKDDALVRVKPILEAVDDGLAYLSDANEYIDMHEYIERHARTGRPLEGAGFVTMLEAFTGKSLAPKRPGRKPNRSSK